MSYFFSRYKFYKSFKIPILSEDKLSIEVEEMVDCEKYAKMIIKDVNLAYISIISDNKFNENDQVKLCISHKKLLKTKRYRFEASIIGSHMNHELNKYIIVIEVNNQEYSDFVLSFIEGFKKKRLKKYLMQSALENKEYDIEEISEIIALMKNGFHSLIKKDDINLNHLLDNCNKFLKSSDSSLYLINSSDNVLERKNTTIKMPSINKIDYRKGIPGIVFSSAELINIYKSKLISLCPANESAPESVLAAPIFNRHKKVIGVLEFINKNEGKRFDLNDEATISMLSLVFSSFFQLYNPVHSTSKIRTFNPSLNKENLKIIEDEMHKDTLPIINKVKNKLESILINSTSSKTLEILVNEIIETSQFHDWNLITINCTESPIHFKHLDDDSILYLKEISSLCREDQDIILDLIERKNIWIISTYIGEIIDTDKLNPEFHTIIAKHHINICHNSNELSITSLIHTFLSTQNDIKSFDDKLKQFEETLQLAEPFDQAN